MLPILELIALWYSLFRDKTSTDQVYSQLDNEVRVQRYRVAGLLLITVACYIFH